MVESAPPKRAGRERIADLLHRIPTLVWIGAAALVAVGVIALLGGLDEADAAVEIRALEELSPGVASGGTPMDVTVLSVTRTTGVPELYLDAEPGQELIIVEVEAENIWDRSTVGIRGAVLLELDGEMVEADRVLVTDDFASVVVLPPRVLTRLTFIWPVPVDTAGDVATLLLTDSVFVPDPVLLDAPYWRDLGPRWVVEAPVDTGTHLPNDERAEQHLTGVEDDL